ncbi:Fc receptor-like protein 5 [Colossoma macropomum]|uniref:Fc receptor-like protein 5 n=1 Tax=Colossoma macropomum TaxID=42526 RepID=UPI0018653F05|nr:Fc receptor-like protein 5 [Colossoma macropomum]
MRVWILICAVALLCSAGEEVVRLQELEGNTVTLHTGITGVQSDQIMWLYESENVDLRRVDSLVIRGEIITDSYSERFRDRLQLDRNSGSLTITNINREDSGVYMLQISCESVSAWSFSVNVYAPVSKPIIKIKLEKCSVSRRDLYFLLCSVENGKDVSLSWYEEKERISSISSSDSSERLYLPLNVTNPNNSTYTCVAANPVSNQTTQLNSTGHYHHTAEFVVRLVLSAMVVLATISILLYHFTSKIVMNTPVSKPIIGKQTEKRSVNPRVSCSPLCSVENGKDVNLSWYEEKERISSISSSDSSAHLYLPLNIINPNNSTYTCVAANPVSNQTTQVNITELCDVNAGLLCSAGEEVVRLQELEGNTITIHTGLKGIQSDAQFLWFHHPENLDIKIVNSLVNDGEIITDYYSERFRDRLQLNRTSGSLTITNISREDSGVYILQIITGRSSEWMFSLNVYATVSSPYITRLSVRGPSFSASTSGSRCSVLCSAESQRGMTLSWFKGREILNQTSDSDHSDKLTLHLEVSDEDQDIYNCVTANPVSNRTSKLNITEICSHDNGATEVCGLTESMIRLAFSVLLAVVTVVLLIDHSRTYSEGRNTTTHKQCPPSQEADPLETLPAAFMVDDS